MYSTTIMTGRPTKRKTGHLLVMEKDTERKTEGNGTWIVTLLISL